MKLRVMITATAIGLAAASAAAAKAPSPGVWTVGEVLTICVRDDGTWYNMNLPITGRWEHIAPWTFFAGDLAPGGNLEGHVAARAHVGRHVIDVTDWGKDLTSQTDWFDVTLGMRFERVSRRCEMATGGAAAAGR